MENKSNKELAIDAALEYTKSWNSAERTQPLKSTDFVNILSLIYDAICKLDER